MQSGLDILKYVDRVPTLEEFRKFRLDAGWRMPPDPRVADSLPLTLYSVCAETDAGEAVGMGRIVGDGGVQVFITDVIVLGTCQEQGIGSEIMKRLMDYIKVETSPDTFVGLFAAKGRHRFYERFGFIVRPNDALGPGMVLLTRDE